MSYLSPNQLKQYEDEGFVSPINIFSKDKAKEIRDEIELIEKEMPEELEKSGRYNAHLISPLLDEVTHNPKILDAVESLIGEVILVCGTTLFIKNPNVINSWKAMDDKNVIEELCKLKGIGPWSAEMFLMFTLNRLDIFPLKDLGIQKGIQQLYKLDKIPSDQYMIKKSNQWAPYRTIASLYLWKLIDGNNFDW